MSQEDKNSKMPEIIYKYRDWSREYHRRMLTHREVYLAAPKELNDPFDCRVTLDFGLLDTDDKIKEYVKVLGERSREKLALKNQKPEDFAEDIFDRIKNHRSEEQENWDNATFASQDERYGVLSLTARWDSILMWGHYAASHSGFCVGFHENKMSNSGIFGRGGLVKYSADFPSIDPKEDYTPERAFRETFTKAEDWQYEQEYRLFKFLRAASESRTVIIDPSFFAELILGLNFPKQSLEDIKAIASALKIPVYQIVKIRGKFLLDRIKI